MIQFPSGTQHGNCQVSDMLLNGGATGSASGYLCTWVIDVYNLVKGKIHNIEIDQTRGGGIYIREQESGKICSVNSLIDITCSNSNGANWMAGYTLRIDAEDVFVVRGYLFYGYGVYCHNTGALNLEFCDIALSAGAGITSDTPYLTVANCKVGQNTTYGLACIPSSEDDMYHHIINNLFYGNGNYDIYLFKSDNCVVTGNVCSSTDSGTSILSATSENNTVQNNECVGLITLSGTQNQRGFKRLSISRDLTAASGSVTYTGVGFQPSSIEIFMAEAGAVATAPFSKGCVDEGESEYVIAQHNGNWYMDSLKCVFLSEAAGDYQYATHSSNNTDGFVLAWTKVGNPVNTAYGYVICYP